MNTHSRSSFKKESYSASQSIFSNTRGLEDSNKVSGWETRYQDAHKFKKNKKNLINSNEKRKQYKQIQPNSGTMNTPFSMSQVLGETMNHNNQQMSWKNSSREQTIEDESSIERQQSLLWRINIILNILFTINHLRLEAGFLLSNTNVCPSYISLAFLDFLTLLLILIWSSRSCLSYFTSIIT